MDRAVNCSLTTMLRILVWGIINFAGGFYFYKETRRKGRF